MNTAMKEKLKKLYSGTVSLALVVCLVFSSLGFFMSSTHASETPPAKITALLYSGDTMPNGEPETDSAMLFKTYVSATRTTI